MHPLLLRLLLVAAIVALAAVVGRWLLAHSGRFREYGRSGRQPGRRLRPWSQPGRRLRPWSQPGWRLRPWFQPGRRLRPWSKLARHWNPWARGARGRGRRGRDGTAGRFDRAQLDAVGLGREGEVSALLLSSPTCAPCRTVRKVLTEVSEARPHFRWVSIDAGTYLDIARDHHVLRVPTLFVLDRDGWILARTSGIPAIRDLMRIVDQGSDDLGDPADRGA